MRRPSVSTCASTLARSLKPKALSTSTSAPKNGADGSKVEKDKLGVRWVGLQDVPVEVLKALQGRVGRGKCDAVALEKKDLTWSWLPARLLLRAEGGQGRILLESLL